jgi:signal transduction histidine kinase
LLVRRESVVAYGHAVICVIVALGVTKLLGAWALPDYTALYALAVLLASSVGGLGPGMLATVLAAAATAYEQVGWTSAIDLGWDDAFRAAVFIVVAAVVSSLAARQRAAEEKLRRAVIQLQEADRAKDDFLATVSHELRTPLTSILGWAMILGEPDLDRPTLTLAAESIRQSATSQQIIVDDLLDVSRIVFRKFRIDMRPLDLLPLARATADLIRPSAVARGIELRVELPSAPCVIEGDEQRIKQVIWNFLANAVKFTPGGGSITLRLRLAGPDAEISVSDTGAGIEAAAIPTLFDRFQQGEGGRRRGGLGLGLAIARHVVEAHHGSISAQSEGRDRGATFVARFPRIVN